MVIASSLLGGGARAGRLSDATLELLALPLLLAAVWRLGELLGDRRTRGAVYFCLAAVALPLLQLVPLPPEIWTRFPYRDAALETFELIGNAPAWLPISLSPRATWLAALSLIPPLAVFLGTLLLQPRERERLSLMVLAVGLVAATVGLLQVAQGAASPLRPFDDTSGEAVGFFANRNHFAALLYSLTLLAAAWSVHLMLSGRALESAGAPRTMAIIGALVSFTVLVSLVAAQLMARSRAGLGLTIVALLGAGALGLFDRRHVSGLTPTRVLAGATMLAVLFASQFALFRLLQRFEADPFEDARIRIFEITLAAAKALMPLGAGMGTFVQTYALFEGPEDALRDVYINRAHNDVLELWLEGGIPALGLMAIFAVWFTVRTFRLWRRKPSPGQELDTLLARAATLIVALVALHSLVDYPLRTSALLTTMAFVVALMIEPPRATRDVGLSAPAARRPQPVAHPQPASAPPPGLWTPAAVQARPPVGPSSPSPSGPPMASAIERWDNADIAWPKDWVRDPTHPSRKDETDSS